MKFKIFGKTFEFGVKNQQIPAISNEQLWTEFLRASGHSVSHDTALKVAVVIRCADVVAKTMASIGCHLYKDTAAGKERAKSNPLYRLLRYLPNPETTAYEFWHMYVFSLMLTKGAYAKIVRDNNGFIKEIWNIPSSRVHMNRNTVTQERYIDVHFEKGKFERIYEGNFMYSPGLRFANDEKPEDFIRIAGDVLGLTMNLNSYAKDYFENGSNMGGFISYPQGINFEGFNRFKEDWKRAYSGVANAHKWAILEGGFTVTKMDSNPEQAQALESRKFQVIEVCRMMGVPPSKVFAMETVSYNSMEQSNIEYVQESLSPMSERITQTIYKDLLTTAEQKKHFVKFNINALLRGDVSARTTYYHNARQDGWMSANDIRELEDMDKIPPEEGGDIYAINGNMIPLTAVPMNLPKGALKGGNTG